MNIRGLPKQFDGERECKLFLFGLKALFHSLKIQCGSVTGRNYMRQGRRYPILELEITLPCLIEINIRYELRQIEGSGGNKFWVLSDYWSNVDFSCLINSIKDND